MRDGMVFRRARGHIGRRSRIRCLPAALALMTLTAGCSGGVSSATGAQRLRVAPVARVVPLKQARRPTNTNSTNRTSSIKNSKSAQQLLSAAVAPLVATDGAHASVAVDDLSTGQTASYGGAREYDTASIVKVDILSALLYQAQQEGRPLTQDEQELATRMIENSDNGAASALFDDIGADSGLDEANQAFGLTQTTAGVNGAWGLTTTTVDDQIRLLRLVFTTPSVLTADSRGYIQSLMGQVEPDQQWGVSAAADEGTPFEVKNGWLPNPSLWEINSIGEVTHDGQTMLIAVLSSDNQTEGAGISLVQDLAVQAADAVAQGQ